jgi:hypothetical protein
MIDDGLSTHPRWVSAFILVTLSLVIWFFTPIEIFGQPESLTKLKACANSSNMLYAQGEVTKLGQYDYSFCFAGPFSGHYGQNSLGCISNPALNAKTDAHENINNRLAPSEAEQMTGVVSFMDGDKKSRASYRYIAANCNGSPSIPRTTRYRDHVPRHI